MNCLKQAPPTAGLLEPILKYFVNSVYPFCMVSYPSVAANTNAFYFSRLSCHSGDAGNDVLVITVILNNTVIWDGDESVLFSCKTW